jgi:2-amino-4-hydroxy-6-hydroxymethyldihydropteridine diphosphokinase
MEKGIIHTIAHIGIGSNVGDRKSNCLRASEYLDRLDMTHVVKVSSLYLTEPVGVQSQEWFINSVVIVDTRLTAESLLAGLQTIEDEMGRVRTMKWGPRNIDLDLLFFGDYVIQKESIIVPHPELAHRRFVLEPLNEVDPDKVHPILNRTVHELTISLNDGKRVIRIP